MGPAEDQRSFATETVRQQALLVHINFRVWTAHLTVPKKEINIILV